MKGYMLWNPIYIQEDLHLWEFNLRPLDQQASAEFIELLGLLFQIRREII